MVTSKNLVLLVGIAVLMLVAIYMTTPNTKAQDNNLRLQTLFEQLNVRLQNESNFAFSIQVNVPVKAESLLVIGTMPDSPSRTLYEIGTDYVCLREPAGLAEAIWCVPYSNISNIAWINSQS
jgi:hypothetical protein